VLCGLLYGLCFPPVRQRWLAWVVLAPPLVAMRRHSVLGAMLVAGTLAAAGAGVTVNWLPGTVTTYFQQPAAVGVLLFAAVTAVMVVPPYALFGAVYRCVGARPAAWVPSAAAAAWVVNEYARAHAFTGNPWVLLGYSQVGADHVVQIADLAGVYGITFVVALVNATLAEVWLALRAPERPAAPLVGAPLLATALVVANLVYGHVRLTEADHEHDHEHEHDVAIIQGNLDLGAQWRQEMYGTNLETYLRMTLQVLRDQRPALVVWPENAMTFFLEKEPMYQAAIAQVLAPFGAQLVAGGPHTWNVLDPQYHNSVFVLAPDGRVLARYDKEHLLPFAEYFPFRQADLLRRDFGRVREFTPGGPGPPLATVVGAAGVLICNEAMFPEIARARVQAGADYLLNLTNDTWVPGRQFAGIAFDMSVLRAIEQRRWLIRASTAGPSAIVDPWGRVTVRSALGARAMVTGAIERRTHASPYGRMGDRFAAACAVLSAAILIWLCVRRGTRPV